jgi:uncharacterized protein (DUF1800 family)
MPSPQVKNQHILWRAGFGQSVNDLSEIKNKSTQKVWRHLLQQSSSSPQKIEVAVNLFDGVLKGFTNLSQFESLSKDQKKQLQQQSREDIKKLNLAWMNEMVSSKAQVRERVSLFWHGHFACRVINIYYQQQLLHIIRENALGNFGDLLRAVSKSAAMLQFLNNKQNKKRKPNENFAREVMELFTMGRGNYTEKDIKEAARAFTGWSFTIDGAFEFKENQHDSGEKTILGKTGNFDGDDVIDILLQQKQTAVFITRKIYTYFVNEKPDEAKVQWLSERFYKNKYDIKKLLDDIVSSDWFYEDKNVGTKIKSPVDLLVGLRRMLPMQLENEASLVMLQKALGQLLFYPPNVAGWPGGKSWIDSSTLMLRLRIPQIVALNEKLSIRLKADDDTQMGRMEEDGMVKKKLKEFIKKGASATIDWSLFLKVFEKTPRENLLVEITNLLFQTKSRVNAEVLEAYLNKENREAFIKSVAINVMSTPEYQLC